MEWWTKESSRNQEPDKEIKGSQYLKIYVFAETFIFLQIFCSQSSTD